MTETQAAPPRAGSPRSGTPGADTPGAVTPGADTPGSDTSSADEPGSEALRAGTPAADPPPDAGPPGLAVRTLLSGRYRLRRRLRARGGAETWLATDEVLGRDVSVLALPADDPRADRVEVAARRAARVTDEHFLRVLDVDRVRPQPPAGPGAAPVPQPAPVVHVVAEWTPGRSLTAVLAAGPLDPAQATVVAREVAEAVAAAHAQGLSHRVLDADRVLVSTTGAVRVVGLEVAAALAGLGPAENGDPGTGNWAGGPQPTDVRSVGEVLYAALTARWPVRRTGSRRHRPPPGTVRPGGPPDRGRTGAAPTPGGTARATSSPTATPTATRTATRTAATAAAAAAAQAGSRPAERPALPPAPRSHGTLLRPGLVRPGIPRPVDDLVVRTLHLSGAAGGPPVTSARELAGLLGQLSAPALDSDSPRRELRPLGSDGTAPAVGGGAPGVAPGSGPAPAADPVDPGGPAVPAGPAARPGGRVVARLSLAVLIAFVVGLALLVALVVGGLRGSGRGGVVADARVPSPSPAAPGRPGAVAPLVPTAVATVFGPTAVSDFDPDGDDGAENPGDVRLATDGDPDTAWRTSRYATPRLGGLKPGVGLLVDLGQVRPVRRVELGLVGSGTDVELLTAGLVGLAPTRPGGYTVSATVSDAGGGAALVPTEPVLTRYLVVWLTRLPADGDRFQGGIRSLSVTG